MIPGAERLSLLDNPRPTMEQEAQTFIDEELRPGKYC